MNFRVISPKSPTSSVSLLLDFAVALETASATNFSTSADDTPGASVFELADSDARGGGGGGVTGGVVEGGGGIGEEGKIGPSTFLSPPPPPSPPASTLTPSRVVSSSSFALASSSSANSFSNISSSSASMRPDSAIILSMKPTPSSSASAEEERPPLLICCWRRRYSFLIWRKNIVASFSLYCEFFNSRSNCIFSCSSRLTSALYFSIAPETPALCSLKSSFSIRAVLRSNFASASSSPRICSSSIVVSSAV
mmetsp:Transcript_18144/g.33721  ORF Transcript_18144/g.33721 Transcript_18144/m.33721 type:complete len:252 (-) Transcript_18144:145-900(-)